MRHVTCSPCEGINLFSKLAEEDVLGGVSEDQHDVHVSRPQLHQVAHVSDVRQLRHLHKVLLWRPTMRQKPRVYASVRMVTAIKKWNEEITHAFLPWSTSGPWRLIFSFCSIFCLWFTLFIFTWVTEKHKQAIFSVARVVVWSVHVKATDLKAWITTVPNKMNKAEKMRDSRGIISRLQGIKETSWLCILCPNREKTVKKSPPTSCCAGCHQWLQPGSRRMHRSIGSKTSVENIHTLFWSSCKHFSLVLNIFSFQQLESEDLLPFIIISDSEWKVLIT